VTFENNFIWALLTFIVIVEYVSLKPVSVTPGIALVDFLSEVVGCRTREIPRSIEVIRIVCYFNGHLVDLLDIGGVLSLY
jgi:hypothetical protein